MTDDLKGAYTKKGDRYELNELDSSHSLVVAQKEVTEKADSRQKEIDKLNVEKGNLERERDEAKGKTIPHGFRAVSKEVAELGEAVKASGLSKDEIGTLKTENDQFKSEKAKTEGVALRKEAAKALGYANEDAFARLAEKLEIVKDGDKFKVGEDVLSKEFIEKSEDFAPFIGSLNEKKTKTPFPDQGGGENGNIYDHIRATKEAENKAATGKVDVGARFGRPATN